MILKGAPIEPSRSFLDMLDLLRTAEALLRLQLPVKVKVLRKQTRHERHGTQHAHDQPHHLECIRIAVQ